MNDNDHESALNPTSNPSFFDVLQLRLSRRALLKNSAAFAAVSALPVALADCATGTGLKRDGALGFRGVPVSTDDRVRVPEGYTTTAFYRWGDPIGHVSGSPAFKPDASNSADEQALQAGMHHDGIHFFPLPHGSERSDHGLLTMNHEYVDDGLLHADGLANWSAEKVLKAQHAHGVSVIEVRMRDGKWEVLRPSKYARRVTARTPMRISGPAAGSAGMRTADIKTGEIRRFLTGPNGCEITGVVTTPDGKTMFVNIQHPGETSSERNDPKTPMAVSNGPDGPGGGRPRSATIVIRKNDGGVIGT